MTYRIFGLVVKSDVALPELRPSRARRADISVTLRRRPATAGHWRPLRVSPDAKGWLQVSRSDGSWRIRFPRVADFVVSDHGTAVSARRAKGISLATVRHLLLDQVIPLLATLRGQVIVHAAAVSSAGGAILMVGNSGAGKSTLAVSLAFNGWKLLSDDVVRVRMSAGTGIATAAYAGARLWPDAAAALAGRRSRPLASYTTKRRLAGELFDRAISTSAAVRRIYLIGPAARAVSIRRASPREALIALIRQTIRLDTEDPRTELRSLDTLAAICASTGVRHISFPRRLARLGDIRAAIAGDLSRDS